MTLNQVGGLFGALALAVILLFHHHEVEKREPVRPAPVAAEPVRPAPKAEPTPAPEPEHQFPSLIPCIGDGKCGPRREPTHPVFRPKPVYHRVLKGGKIDGPMDCKQVPEIAKKYPPAVVIRYAKKMGMDPETLGKLRACLN